MNETERRECINIFNEGFEALMGPHLERIDARFDAVDRKLEKLDAIEAELGRMDRKLSAVVDRLDEHGGRIKRLESPSP